MQIISSIHLQFQFIFVFIFLLHELFFFCCCSIPLCVHKFHFILFTIYFIVYKVKFCPAVQKKFECLLYGWTHPERTHTYIWEFFVLIQVMQDSFNWNTIVKTRELFNVIIYTGYSFWNIKKNTLLHKRKKMFCECRGGNTIFSLRVMISVLKIQQRKVVESW